jgi:mono/diheme cytochrome c family protein
MTEIPEHLLARSRARRAAAGLGGDAAPAGGEVEVASTGATPAASPAAATPATQAAPAPPPPPPPPTPPYIQAYKDRRKIPFWVMPVLLALPLYLFIYANTLVKPSAGETGALATGKTLYVTNCSGCHGASGEGGVGPAFTGGAVITTWPDFKDHIKWVSLGSGKWPDPTYGAQSKPIGSGGMPTFAQSEGGPLTPLEIAQIVRYEREILAGAPPDPALVAITEGTAPPIGADGKPVG